ncbi:hypothetical protein PV325_000595 [Microctonus aethiopoides]|nr:hypothetical protein PV325_000595 [Microctonus aethiopoides]
MIEESNMVLTMCCGCFTVETGTLMIGILHLVTSCCGCTSLKKGSLIISILCLISGIINIVLECNQPQGIVFAIGYVIATVMSILAARGIENPSLILPLVSLYIVGLFIASPMMFIYKIQQAIIASAPGSFYAMIILLTIIGFAIEVYFFMVIYSYYKELLREKYAPSKIDIPANV